MYMVMCLIIVARGIMKVYKWALGCSQVISCCEHTTYKKLWVRNDWFFTMAL